MRRGRRLTPSPMNNIHKYYMVSRLLYTVDYTSRIHIQILQILTEQTSYTEINQSSIVHDMPHNL
jgi:hypothetical protein